MVMLLLMWRAKHCYDNFPPGSSQASPLQSGSVNTTSSGHSRKLSIDGDFPKIMKSKLLLKIAFTINTAASSPREGPRTVPTYKELWFQQDGATCHTARALIDLLKYTFGDRLISRFGPVNWPPRFCDLTPLDYFLWGYLKSLVYADKPQTLDHLEDNIRRVINDIRPQMLEKVIENWTSRLDYIRASRGSPMPEIILKM
ncbi:DNA-directed RNA polymerase subunit [Trichonephila clavipes]|nr:DNA-directed RNA polymerase subunit [Trichonephila clavipes]